MLDRDADDSSDAEDTEVLLKKYDLETGLKDFKNSRGNTSYLHTVDPEGYSFLSYSMGVQILHSPQVNAVYNAKKAGLPKTTALSTPDQIKTWLTRTTHETIRGILKIESQSALSAHLAEEFLREENDLISAEISAWLGENLRIFFKQGHFDKETPQLKACLSEIFAGLDSYVKAFDVPLETFAPPPFFLQDDFDEKLKDYIEAFYKRVKIIRPTGKFQTAKDWPKVENKVAIEKLMLQEASKYNGRQTIQDVTVATKKLVFDALLEKELSKGENSVVEKIEGKYRLKRNVDVFTLEEYELYWLFDENGLGKYLPYNNERLIEELEENIKSQFIALFLENLKRYKKQLDITLQRGLLPQQQTFSAKSLPEHLANLRQNMRDKRRRIRQAKDDEKRETITGESFNAAWQMPTQHVHALENQTVSSGCARTDVVTNLETYKGIDIELYNFKVNINSEIKSRPKISDKLIAAWIRNILQTGAPIVPRVQLKESATLSTRFEDIPTRFQKPFLRFLVNFTYLLFGCEAQRNPGSLVIHQMMLELIEAKELTWTQALANSNFEHNCGGGEMPMSMGKYLNANNKKVRSEPVACARRLHSHYGFFAAKHWRYDGESVSTSPGTADDKHLRELLRRENAMVKKWLAFNELDDKPIADQIQGIQTAIDDKWYPKPK